MKMGKIEVVSSSVVKMANYPSPSTISTMKLTPWDLQMLLLDPIQKGLLFHKSKLNPLIIINRLKSSLSRALDFFPPLAGRLDAATFSVDCNNAGVEFDHAVAVGVSVSDILEAKYIPEIVSSSFFPLNKVGNYEGVRRALLGVQVTEIEDGIFVGITANHSVVDGVSFWHFINSWSELCRGLDEISKTPVFDRTKLPTNIRLPPLEHLLSTTPKFVRPPLLERVFHFSKETLSKLKSRANSEAGCNKISTLQALSAHLWRCITRCRGRREEAEIMMVVGARSRIPLADGYFGNAVRNASIAVSETELLQKGLGHAALKINRLVNLQSGEEMMKSVEDWAKNPILMRKGSDSFPKLVISSSPRHNVYGNDFGWGKPIAVRSGEGQKSDGKITVYPAEPIGGGIDAEVCLAPETMEALGEDPEFMEAFTVSD